MLLLVDVSVAMKLKVPSIGWSYVHMLACVVRPYCYRSTKVQSIHSLFIPWQPNKSPVNGCSQMITFFKWSLFVFLRIITTLVSAVICSRVGTTSNCLLSSLHELGGYLSPPQLKWYAMGEQSRSRLPVIQPLRDQQNRSYYLAGWTK